jgi:hypothetical protein
MDGACGAFGGGERCVLKILPAEIQTANVAEKFNYPHFFACPDGSASQLIRISGVPRSTTVTPDLALRPTHRELRKHSTYTCIRTHGYIATSHPVHQFPVQIGKVKIK